MRLRLTRYVWIKWLSSITTIVFATFWSLSKNWQFSVRLPPTARVIYCGCTVADEMAYVFGETTTPDAPAFDHLQRKLCEKRRDEAIPLVEVRKIARSISCCGFPYHRLPSRYSVEHTYPCRNSWKCSLGSKCPLQGKVFLASELSFPLWIPTVITLIPALWAIWKDRFFPRGCCQYCGFDLRSTKSGFCTECGKARERSEERGGSQGEGLGRVSYILARSKAMMFLRSRR